MILKRQDSFKDIRLKQFLVQAQKPLKAKPGISRRAWQCLLHQVRACTTCGLAVDIANASEPKRINWLIANVKKFGFSWEVVPSEPWHLRYVDGDNPPPAVAEWMAKNNWTKPAGSVAPAASGDNEISKLQEALKAKGFYKGEINGQKDSATDAAIKAFKVANKLAADSVPGPKVKELLGLA